MGDSTPTEAVQTMAVTPAIPGTSTTPVDSNLGAETTNLTAVSANTASPSLGPAASTSTLNNGTSWSTQSLSLTSEPGSVSTSITSLSRSSSFTHPTTSSLQESLITTSSSSASIPTTHHASSGISDGSLAGAIVGSIAGTFLLTLLGAILLFRRRRNRKSHAETNGGRTTTSQIYVQPTHSSLSSAKKAGMTAQSVPIGAQYLDMSCYVPQPPDDDTTALRIQTLFDRASLHIDNYYSAGSPRSRLSQGGVAPSSIEHYDSDFLPGRLTVMLSKPRAGGAVLTHVLVRALLQGIEPGRQTRCLLPTPYASGLSVNMDNDDTSPIFAWRMLTAYLHRIERPAQNSPALTPPEDVIELLAERFSTTFVSYSDPQFSDSDRLAHLISVFRAASDLGIWLFSHPCGFDYRWDTGSISSDQVILFPAVFKVSDEFGRRLSEPQMLVERKVARV